MKKRTDHIVQVTLIVKESDPVEAERTARRKLGASLNRWFTSDLDHRAPYPEGSLLWYGVRTVTDNERENT